MQSVCIWEPSRRDGKTRLRAAWDIYMFIYKDSIQARFMKCGIITLPIDGSQDALINTYCIRGLNNYSVPPSSYSKAH